MILARLTRFGLGITMAVIAAPVVLRAQPAADEVHGLLSDLEQIMRSGSAARYLALVSDAADRGRVQEFLELELLPGASRIVIQERDRQPLPGAAAGYGYRVLTDVLIEFADKARAATWRIDLKRAGADRPLQIVDQEEITSVDGLYRLSLDGATQFNAHDLTISAEDFDIILASGSVFVSKIEQGIAALVLLGQGEMHFHPKPEAEREQVRIFCGQDTLAAVFDAAFIRVNPSELADHLAGQPLRPRAADPREFKRAADLFRDELPKSFVLDLGDLSRDTWSLVPASGDFLAEIRTRRFGDLTYARSLAEAEDVTLFDRKRRRNISIYASERKFEQRGRFFNEDDLTSYDVLDYQIDATIAPEREWIEGQARLTLRVRTASMTALTLRLADALVVRSIVSDRFGRLFNARVRDQSSVVVSLPANVPRDTVMILTVTYSGRLEPETPDREAAQIGQGPPRQRVDELRTPTEPRLLYSNRAFWYPQGMVTGYATATIRLAVPLDWDCVASGDLEPSSPAIVTGKQPGQIHREYRFSTAQPVRYLAFVVSRFIRSDTATLGLPRMAAIKADRLPVPTGILYDTVRLAVEANPRQVPRGQERAARAAEILQFYASLVGDCPYPSLTIALLESERPGGHSPAYFAALNEPLALTLRTWRNDPASFDDFPEFFLAHEIAHQWWGQAVGWRNYHEWLSEGFAQYFAALYAQRRRGDDAFAGMMRQMRKWAVEDSPEGPVYLGYRLGHIRGEPRVFTALVYNKGAAVLHMLRRLVGDEAFFRGLRRFYATWRFRKASTDDFRVAMELESNQPLGRFFERWIYSSALPKLKLTYRVDSSDVVLRVDQIGEIFDVPLSLLLKFADRKPLTVVMRIDARSVEMRVPLAGVLRGVNVNKDDRPLADFVRE